LDREGEESIYIPFQFLNTALNGDEVEVFLLPIVSREKIQGEVLRIVKRKKIDFVGTIAKKKKDNFAFLVPDNPKMYTDIFLPRVPPKARNNSKALARITRWEDPKKNPEGKILKVIGEKGNIDAEMESIAIEKGFRIEFPEEAEREAGRIKKESRQVIKKEEKKRKDFRNVFTFTIDPEDAKDFDDAISFRKIDNNLFEIGVHIADVSFWVGDKSPITEEAVKRGYSLYLVDRTIPMLPEALSNDICSLNPGEDKLTFSVIFHINGEGKIEKTRFLKTIINSDRKLSYGKAQEEINAGRSRERAAPGTSRSPCDPTTR